tara:strand:+ start:221 stop:586 length:366 start_codon:yes stop_codon:yes gene_type:complete
MSGFLFDPSFTGVHRVLDLRQQQHAMTASNLANANTPGFKAQYLDFSTALSDAMTAPLSEPTIDADVVEVEAPAWSVNGNSVFLEQEHARLRSNAVLYQGLVRGVSSRLALLKFAAADGRA